MAVAPLSSSAKERMSASGLLSPTGYLQQTYNGAMSVPPTTPYGTTCAGMHPQRSFPPLLSQGMACETIPPSVDHGIELPVIDLKDLDHLLPATNGFSYSNVGAAAQNDEIPAIQPSNQNPVTSTAALSAVSNTLNNGGPEQKFASQLNMHHLCSPTTLPACSSESTSPQHSLHLLHSSCQSCCFATYTVPDSITPH